MFVRAKEQGTTEQYFAVEITGCYLGIRVKNPDLFEDNSMANGYGFLWESENPTEVNEDGVVIRYKDNVTAETFVVEAEALYDIPEDEEVYTWLKDPDNSPIITAENPYIPGGDVCYSVEVSEIFNNENFYQWLLWRKKDFLLAPLRLHGNSEDSIESQITLNRKMINEQGRQLASHNRVRKLISWTNKNNVLKLNDFTCEWNASSFCFNKIFLSIDFINTCKERAGLEFYGEGNIRYTRLAFCWALRERNNTNEPIPGALYAEIQKYEDNQDYYYDSENNLYKSNVIEIRKDVRYEYTLSSKNVLIMHRDKQEIDSNTWKYKWHSLATGIGDVDYDDAILASQSWHFDNLNPYQTSFTYEYKGRKVISWTLEVWAHQNINENPDLTLFYFNVKPH